MEIRKWMPVFFVIILAFTILAGCANGNTPGDTPTPTQTIAHTTAARIVKVYSAPG